MKRFAFSFFVLLLAMSMVFASVVAPVSVLYPNNGEVISRDLNILFTVNGFSAINNIDLLILNSSFAINDTNFFDFHNIECSGQISTNPICYFDFNTLLIPDGNYRVYVDPNNTTPPSNAFDESNFDFVVDNTAPVISWIQPANVSWVNPSHTLFSATLNDAVGINQTSIKYSVAGNTFTISYSGLSFNSVNKRLDFDSTGIDFNNGQLYTAIIDVNDLARNNVRSDRNFFVDLNNPIVFSVLAPIATNDSTPDLNISASDQNGLSGLSKLYLSCNGTTWSSRSFSSFVSDFNILSCNPTDGNKVIYVKVSDNADNNSSVTEVTILFDSTAPVLSITTTPVLTGTWVDTNVFVDLNCSEPDATIQYWLNGTYTSVLSNYVGFFAPIDRNNILIATCIDAVGNKDSNSIISIAIDTTTPSPSIFSIDSFSHDQNVVLDWSDSNRLSDLNYFVWRTAPDENSFTPFIGPLNDSNLIDANSWTDGNYCYFIQTINQFGKDTNSIIHCTYLDRVNPIFDINLTASVSNSTVTLSYSSATDANGSGIKGYFVSKDGIDWNFTSLTSYYFTNLANGTYTFFVKATDFADNNSLDKNTSAIVNVTTQNNTGGSSGGSGGGRTAGTPVDLNNSDTNTVIPLTPVPVTSNSLPNTVDQNTSSNILTTTDQNNSGLVALTPTASFSLLDTLNVLILPILLLILILLILFVMKRRAKPEPSLAGPPNIKLINDTPDFPVNYNPPKWEYKGKGKS